MRGFADAPPESPARRAATYALKTRWHACEFDEWSEGGVAAGSACSELVERADPGSRPQRGQLQAEARRDKAALDAVGRELKARTDKTAGRRCISAKWTPDPATGAKLRSWD